jgi:hypothetical protein
LSSSGSAKGPLLGSKARLAKSKTDRPSAIGSSAAVTHVDVLQKRFDGHGCAHALDPH